MLARLPIRPSLTLVAVLWLIPQRVCAEEPQLLEPRTILVPPAPESDPLPVPARDARSWRADENWTIQVRPAAGSRLASFDPGKPNYEELYQSIPYRRAEYLANPSYRHEAAMEMYFGKMRPTVIQRTDSAQRIVNPRPELYRPYLMSQGELSTFWSQRPFWGWTQPQLGPWVLP